MGQKATPKKPEPPSVGKNQITDISLSAAMPDDQSFGDGVTLAGGQVEQNYQ